MTEIRCISAPWSDSIEVLILERLWPLDSGRRKIAKPLIMEELKEGMIVTEPTLRMDRTAAQQLMDNLWQCGLRPSEGSGSAGAMAATQKHLEDMRRLVFVVDSSNAARDERKP